MTRMSRMSRRHSLLVAFLMAVAVGITVTGSSALGAPNARALDKLTVAIIAPNANFAPVFVAKSEGLFEKYGLDVEILENAGANTLNYLVSGRADVTLFATPNTILLANRGQPTTAFMSALRDSGAALVGGPNFDSLADLTAAGSSCRISTTQAGTQAYGYAYFYTRTDKLNLKNCSIDQAPSNAIAVARLASGQVSAVVLPLPFAITFVNRIGANLLISPNTRTYRKQFGLPNFSSSVYFGLSSVVKEKRPQLINFIKAINDTNKLLVPKNLNRLTRDLQPFDSFKAVDAKSLRTSLQFIISYMGVGANYADPALVKKFPNRLSTNPGYLPRKIWDASLQQYAQWGIPDFNPSGPEARYGARVDMSLLAQALRSRR